MNAMALIAPGAFLWITFQLQAAQTGPDGKTSTAFDTWPGLLFALCAAMLTAIAYSEMAKIYPDAGYGSAYYFADKTFLDHEEHGKGHEKFARLAKLVTGWAAHLFYWVYPGVMVAMMATLISYMYGVFVDGASLTIPMQIAVAVVFALICGAISARGIQGSVMTCIVCNILQWIMIAIFCVLAVMYRLHAPDGAHFVMAPDKSVPGFSGAADIMMPHAMSGVLFQATIAILVLVGFESCTALGAEAKDPKHSVPKGVIISLIVQGWICYLLEYFCACYAVSDKLVYDTTDATTKAVTHNYGMAAAGASSAPIGDMMKLFGDSLFHAGVGKYLTIMMGITVILAVLGTTLACLNTGVRVTYAMAKDEEMPELLGLMHGKFGTPIAATWMLTIVSAIIGGYGVTSVVGLTGISISSNLGTFILYTLICIWTIIAFWKRAERNVLKHVLIPIVGLIMNVLLAATILFLSFASGGDSAKEGKVALIFAGVSALMTIVWVIVNSAKSGRKLVPSKSIA